MPKLSYSCQDKRRSLNFKMMSAVDEQVMESADAVGTGPAFAGSGTRSLTGKTSPKAATTDSLMQEVRTALADKRQRSRLDLRFHDVSSSEKMVAMAKDGTIVIPTECVVVTGIRTADCTKIAKKFGLEIVQIGLGASYLLRSPEAGEEGVRIAFEAADYARARFPVSSAQPNFLTMVPVIQASGTAVDDRSWGLDNPGNPGVQGADVHGLAAWTISEGDSDVKVAVVDEGVDSLHPWLRDAIVAELDMVDENDHARPDGDDSHGTSCAGIIGSRHENTRGLAPGVSLVGVRIAKRDSRGRWTTFDQFDTADAIRWACDEEKVDVISNSWVCNPSDEIVLAIEHAFTNGRGGKGCVVVGAAGNLQRTTIDFPANVDGVITVGASNQWDERKTRTSRDGEAHWGSNSGPELDVLAPGVAITTTDIRGARGAGATLRTNKFNGTSAGTPHVAAAAALMLSINRTLKADEVKRIICDTADHLTASGDRNNQVGHGRLNTYDALRMARVSNG